MPNDRTLAPLFLARGARFIEAGRWARARGFSDELVLSQLCWGLELALKGYLLAKDVARMKQWAVQEANKVWPAP